MLSNRALALAMGLAVLPQTVHAAEGAARCVDASAPKHAAEARRGEWIELTSDQWHFLRAALRRQALIKIDGCSGGMVVFIDGDKACTPLAVPDELLAMMDDVATATISHEGTAL